MIGRGVGGVDCRNSRRKVLGIRCLGKKKPGKEKGEVQRAEPDTYLYLSKAAGNTGGGIVRSEGQRKSISRESSE